MNKQDFIDKGFLIIDRTQNNENKLWKFIKENYSSIIKDNEINL